ncbi:MAG: SPFH domain-containing protein [Oscillospiraceae bacterium]|nr:SPFH domain-containing protein [Oscillospiraceae bacterium]
MKMSIKSGIISIVILAMALLAVVPSIFTVQTGEVVAVRQFGVVREAVPPGIHFRLWFIHSRERFDVRVREVDLNFATYSIDAQSVQGQVSIQYHLHPHAVVTVTEEFGRLEMLESRLHAMLLQEIQNVFASSPAMQLVEHRAELSGNIQRRIGYIADQFHVTITAVALEHLQFSPAFEYAVEQRLIAEQERDRALVFANQQLEVARLEAQAVTVRARADAEALEIMQQAWGDLGEAVREIMLRQLAIESWDGVLPQVVADSNFSLILDSMG